MSEITVEKIIEKIELGKLEKIDIRNAVDEQITKLDLSNNMFIYELPECICEWICLQRIILSHVHISKLPKNIGKLKQLKYLSLQFTNIVEFPDSFYDLEMLEYSN